MKRKYIRGTIDPILFKTIIDKEMKIKQEHTKMLGDFLVAQGMKIGKGKNDKTFDEVFEVLKQTIIQVKKLKESYDKES